MNVMKILACWVARRGAGFFAPLPAVMLCGCLCSGCGSHGSAPALDTDVAQTSLTTFLDAWKNGRTVESLSEDSPEIIAGDHRWKSAMRLRSYQVLPETTNDGSNLHVPVELELEDSSGELTTEQVTYIVGTRPKITVFALEQ
jgi:hypothetical protein